jgi:hypothetical protein
MSDTPPDRSPAPARRWITFIVAFPVLFVLMLTWAIATPPMASPDEPAHAMRAAAAGLGQPDGIPTTKLGPMRLEVPRYFAEAEEHISCFRRDILSTPACVNPVDDPLAIVVGESTAGMNPSPFYVAAGWPAALFDGARALYAMRAMVALICSALLALAFTALRQLPRSRWAQAGLVVGITPMTLFLGGVVNPNGVEACAAVAMFAWLVLTVREPSGSRLILTERTAIVTASALVLISTRSVSLIWLLMIAAIGFTFSRREVVARLVRAPILWIGVAIIGVASVAGLLFYTRPQEVRLTYTPIGAGSTWSDGFLTTLDRTLEFGQGWIGQFGWLDTPAPVFTTVVWICAAGALILAGFVLSNRVVRVAMLALALVMVFLPAFTQAALVAEVGYVWQGRYTLALFILLVVLAGIGLDDVGEFRDLSHRIRRFITIGAVILATAHLAAFVWTLKRYVVSLAWDKTWVDMFVSPTWQPPGGWILLSAVYAVAIAVGAIVVSRSLRTGAPLRSQSRMESAVEA